MSEKLSIPAAIVVAGAVIAGAIVLSNARVERRSAPPPREPAESPRAAVGEEETPRIEVRPVDPARDHIRGAPDSAVTLVEYSDTECPFCKRFHPTMQQALKDYDGQLRWVYRHDPIPQLHAKAPKEAEATECAGEGGKFWEYLDRLFEVTPSNDGLPESQLSVIAQDVGLDVAAFEACVESGRFADRVREDTDDALQAGAQGTPYSVILGPAGETIPFSGAQPYENLQRVLDQLTTIDN